MQNFFNRGLVAVLSVPVCSVALAFDGVAVQSSSNFSNLSYQLQDLNVLDGLNPSFTPSTNPADTKTMLFAGAYLAPDYPPSVTFTSLPFDSSNEMITGPDFTASSKSGNDLAVKTNLMLPTVANAVQTATQGQNLAVAGASSTSIWTLGAYSQVTIQGTISSSVSFDMPQLLTTNAPATGRLLGETSYAYFFNSRDSGGDWAYLSGSSGNLYTYWDVDDGPHSGGRDLADSTVSSGDLSKSFSFTAINDSETAKQVFLVFSAGSNVTWSPARDNLGVPEPSTYALMALGLGLMAWRVRATRRG